MPTYGKPAEGLAPWEVCNEEDARRSLEKAEEAVKLMERIAKPKLPRTTRMSAIGLPLAEI